MVRISSREVSADTSRSITPQLASHRPTPRAISKDRKKRSDDTLGADNLVTGADNDEIEAIPSRLEGVDLATGDVILVIDDVVLGING